MVRSKKTNSGQLPHIHIRKGLVAYRTKPLALEQAERFARMTRGNTRFNAVRMHRCHGSKLWYVSYIPAREAVQDQLRETLQGKQDARGAAETNEYGWNHLLYDGHLLISATVTNPKTGGVYTVTADGNCTCPQFEMRLRGTGITCKHGKAFRDFAQSQSIPDVPW